MAVSKRMQKAAKNYAERLMKRTDELKYDTSSTPCTTFDNPLKSDSGGTKHDSSKLRYNLIPASAEIALAEALTHGAMKYSADNWRLGFKWTRSYGALRRHLNAWIDPRQDDI